MQCLKLVPLFYCHLLPLSQYRLLEGAQHCCYDTLATSSLSATTEEWLATVVPLACQAYSSSDAGVTIVAATVTILRQRKEMTVKQRTTSGSSYTTAGNREEKSEENYCLGSPERKLKGVREYEACRSQHSKKLS